MCYKFILAGNLAAIEKKFNVRAGIRLEWEPHYVVSPGDETLVITQQNPGQLTLSKFGLIPSWSKHSVALINARAEGNKNPGNDPHFTGGKSIFMKPAFKRPLVSQRCVVIADAFIEWSAQTKQPYLVYLRDKARPFGMAGCFANVEGGLEVNLDGISENDIVKILFSQKDPEIKFLMILITL